MPLAKSLTAREVRAALRAAACQVAGTIPGEPRPRISAPTAESCYTNTGAVIVEYRPGGLGGTLSAKPLPISPEVETAVRRESQLREAILRVCRPDAPLKGTVIARRIGHKYDGHLRVTLSRLVKEGKLRRATDGSGYVKETSE